MSADPVIGGMQDPRSRRGVRFARAVRVPGVVLASLLACGAAMATPLALHHPLGASDREIRQMSTFWMVPFYPRPADEQWGLLSGLDSGRRASAVTGSWGGLRDRLNEAGVHVGAEYTGIVQGNPIGGAVRTAAWSQILSLYAWANLERLVGWEGGHLLVSLNHEAGSNLSRDIGNLLLVTKASGPYSFRLAHLALQQYFADEAVDLVLGRIDLSFDFGYSPLACYSLTSSICPIPEGLSADELDAPIFPVTTWGGRARLNFRDVFFKAGAYQSSIDLRAAGNNGFDFGIPDDSGVAVAAELGWDVSAALFGKPATFVVGGIWNSNTDVPASISPPTDSARYSFFGTIDQQLTGDEPGSGLSLMLRAAGGPPAVNSISFYADLGLVYFGLLPDRPFDVTALYAAYLQVGEDTRALARAGGAGSPTYELSFELTYAFFPTAWLAIQPDVQGIVRPGGTGGIPDAVVPGLSLTLFL